MKKVTPSPKKLEAEKPAAKQSGVQKDSGPKINSAKGASGKKDIKAQSVAKGVSKKVNVKSPKIEPGYSPKPIRRTAAQVLSVETTPSPSESYSPVGPR